MSTLLDATTLPLSLSVLTVTKGTASKRLRADAQGFPRPCFRSRKWEIVPHAVGSHGTQRRAR